jgi:hypothetical protein
VFTDLFLGEQRNKNLLLGVETTPCAEIFVDFSDHHPMAETCASADGNCPEMI